MYRHIGINAHGIVRCCTILAAWLTLRAAAQMSRSVDDSSNSLVISSAISSGVSLSGSYAKSMVRRCLCTHHPAFSTPCMFWKYLSQAWHFYRHASLDLSMVALMASIMQPWMQFCSPHRPWPDHSAFCLDGAAPQCHPVIQGCTIFAPTLGRWWQNSPLAQDTGAVVRSHSRRWGEGPYLWWGSSSGSSSSSSWESSPTYSMLRRKCKRPSFTRPENWKS